MIQDDAKELFALAQRRDAARYTWLRHLHLLATGSLTLLAGMGTGSGTTGAAHCWLRATWAALGFAILFGGAALFSETAKYIALSEKMQAAILLKMEMKEWPSAPCGKIVTTGKPLWLRSAEAGFLTSLVVATICLVAFALLR